jgi:hypothetical protein
MLILGILGILVVFLWIATILWILARLLAHRQPTADAERFESESRGSWVPEDPCNEARIPVIGLPGGTTRSAFTAGLKDAP